VISLTGLLHAQMYLCF